MKTKRGLRLLSFIMALVMCISFIPNMKCNAMTGTQITITEEGQVVDTFKGVSSVYRPGSWDGTDATYGCYAYVVKFYEAIYGKTVYNLFHAQTPCTTDTDYFEVVTVPQPGDICAQIKTSTNHWSIVKKYDADNGVVKVIDQNNKWTISGVTYAYKNVKYSLSEVTFYRLHSENVKVVGGSAGTTAAATTTEATTKATTTTEATTAAVNTLTVTKGCSKTITVANVAAYAHDAPVSFKSANKAIAKVNKSGKVTGVKKGSTKIAITMSSGKVIKLPVKVKAKKTKLALTAYDVTLPQSSSWQLKSTKVKQSNLTFSSSDTTIAKVTKAGVVKSKKKRGMTYITVKSNTGLSNKCIVRVW